MAVILYPSGVTETFSPKNLVFSDQEILKIFEEYDALRTARLYEVPNTWCVWGNVTEDNNNFNKLGSDIVQEDLYSEVMFIHDSELDPSWMLTDNMILRNYEEFRIELLQFFDDIAENVIKESERVREQQGIPNNLVILNTIGPTEDKRVMFEFDPHIQSTEFWAEKYFSEFSHKVLEFIQTSYKNGDTFVLYTDKKSIIVIADENVSFIVNKVVEYFKKIESYEDCDTLTKVLKKWKRYKAKRKKEDGQA